MANFDQAVELVLLQEGGLHDDPRDAGGLTNFGISQRAFPQIDISTLTRDQAIAIYRKEYWRFDSIGEQRLANLLMSMSVNLGVVGALALLRRALGVTLQWPEVELVGCANRTPGALGLFAKECVRHYIGLNGPYTNGLVNRVIECLL